MHFVISWDEAAKYGVATREVTQRTAALINRHADRFLFGTDETRLRISSNTCARTASTIRSGVRLTPEAQALVKRGNYERLFDAARGRARAWERANVPGDPRPTLKHRLRVQSTGLGL